MNWQQLFDDNGVYWVSRGPNTAKNHISIKCPWCGQDDPSEHLGIALDHDAWGCLRNAAHRGHSSVTLIAAVLGCSYPQARLMAAQYSQSDPGSLDEALATLTLTSEAPRPGTAPSEVLPDFRAIRPEGNTAKFWRYLTKRGFDDPEKVIEQYDLSCALTGRYKERLITPFKDDKLRLIAWTARAIAETVNAPRYLSSSRVKETVFNEHYLTSSKILFVVEGPFDALKLDYYGQRYGARATCVFGTSISADQVMILRKLCKRFDKVVVLFDSDAVEPSFVASDWLPNVTTGYLPDGVKDPGELHETEIKRLVASSLQ